ncbi:hypothetical protein [Paraburkholderia sp. J63]|uniref:hypothetical protein n=1 Tax=Paraburkholderia sp. J63 TaxID=2805434 RepID=UPI002ABD2690|nr:hypothetical protein [Paraburkholderia sp. J63]
MTNTPCQRSTAGRKLTVMLTLALMIGLGACGGGSSNSSSSAANTGGSQTPTDNTGGSGNSTPSTNASFFDGIFLQGSGSGLYQFDSNMANGAVTGTGRTSFSVNPDDDTSFSTTSSVVAGNFTQRYVTQAYITAEGAFTSQSTPYTDIGTNSKIFAKLPQGYELGIQGMSTPLYQVTINTQDVSGQAVSQVVQQDEGPATNGLSLLLGNDNTPMPQGAQMYQMPYTVVTTHLWVNLSAGKLNFASLESAQSLVGGTIQTLGGYRYVWPSANSIAYVEYNGAVYFGEMLTAGDARDVVPAAYNRVAADYIGQRENAALSK